MSSLMFVVFSVIYIFLWITGNASELSPFSSVEDSSSLVNMKRRAYFSKLSIEFEFQKNDLSSKLAGITKSFQMSYR